MTDPLSSPTRAALPAEGPFVVPDRDGPPPETGRRHKALALGAFAGAVAGAAVLGSRFGPTGDAGRWYRRLEKPPFQPPDRVFAPVWTALYTGIAASGYRVWAAPDHKLRRPALALWGAQLVANAAWTPAFFGARRPKVALGILAAQAAATVGFVSLAAPIDAPAAALMAPYLGWTSFAGALNEEIVRRNPDA